MPIADPRSTVLFLPVVRGNYDLSLTQRVVAAMRSAATELNLNAIFPAAEACTSGIVNGDDDVHEYWCAWRERLYDIKALVVFSSDFMRERAVQDTVRMLPPDVPIFMIVNNDDPAKMGSAESGDSLCGSLSVHHNVRMLGRRIIRSCRVNMNHHETLLGKLSEYMRLADGIECMRNMRVALLGVNPNPFATTFTNQMKLFELGFSLNTYELLQFWGDVVLAAQPEASGKTYDGPLGKVGLWRPVPKDDPRVPGAMEQLAEAIPNIVDDERHEAIARALVWVRQVFEEECIDTAAIHCWGEFARFFGFAPCNFAMVSNLLGKPIVCEVDVCHAIMARLAWELTGEAGVILDINNNAWAPRVFNVFHCGQTANNWTCEDACITDWGSLQGMMAPHKFTGISAATTAEDMHAIVFQGTFLKRQPATRGCSGWAYVPNNPEVLRAIEGVGIHHFVALKGQFGSDVADILRFRGITVQNLSVAVPDVDTIEKELPAIDSPDATGFQIYSD